MTLPDVSSAILSESAFPLFVKSSLPEMLIFSLLEAERDGDTDGDAGGGIATALGSLWRGVPPEGLVPLFGVDGDPKLSPAGLGPKPGSFGFGVLNGDPMLEGPVDEEFDTLRVGLLLLIARGTSGLVLPVLSCCAVI